MSPKSIRSRKLLFILSLVILASGFLYFEFYRENQGHQSATIKIDSPIEGAILSSTVNLKASADYTLKVKSVQFRMDSRNICNPDFDMPFDCVLDTILYSDGMVTLSAVATDLDGNVKVSEPINVMIQNSHIPVQTKPPSKGIIHVPENYATIQEAVNVAGDGDIVVVAPGTYSGGVFISGKSIKLVSSYHFTNDPALIQLTVIKGGSPAIQVDRTALNTTIRGFHFVGGTKSVQFFGQGGRALDNFFDNTGSDAISFENVGGIANRNRFLNPSDDSIDVDHPTGDVLIENNIMELSGNDGVEIRNGNYTETNVTILIRNNLILRNRGDGIQIIDYSKKANRKFVIQNNLIRANTQAGLGLMDNGETDEDYRAASIPERIHVLNNTFDSNAYGITGGDNLIAVNNIVSNSSELGVKNIDGSSIVAHTLFFGNRVDHLGSNVDINTTALVDPRFSSNYHLKSGSPAIDRGTNLFRYKSEIVLDISKSRYNGPRVDLGWKEFVSENDHSRGIIGTIEENN